MCFGLTPNPRSAQSVGSTAQSGGVFGRAKTTVYTLKKPVSVLRENEEHFYTHIYYTHADTHAHAYIHTHAHPHTHTHCRHAYATICIYNTYAHTYINLHTHTYTNTLQDL